MGISEKRTSIWRRKRWLKWVIASFLVAIAVVVVVVDFAAHRAEPFVRQRVVAALSERFHARVELDAFHLSVGNSLHGEWGLWAHGRGLRIWPPAKGIDASETLPPAIGEPVINLGEFSFHAPLHHRSGDPIHIAQVRLKGLKVHIPPRSHRHKDEDLDGERPTSSHSATGGVRLLIDRIEGVNAVVEIGTDKPDKLPMEFDIARFKVKNVTPGAPMDFEAELTNPRPPGVIHSKGSFGPWNLADPGESPVKGDYKFEHADLSVFKGIAGILSSTGRYQGTLRNIVVDGQTETPDFQLTKFAHTMPLRTTFHAVVDGTNGDTWLQPVDAMLGKSHFTAEGQVVRVLSVEDGRLHSIGHDIALTVNVDRARIEDFLRLSTDSVTPMLVGNIAVKASVHIPPGEVPVNDKITVKGRFALDDVEFTSASVQDRIRKLSLRGQGRTKELKYEDPTDQTKVKSHMDGEFDLGGGTVKLPSLTYAVPGADIHLKGSYHTQSDNLDFVGTATMQATISQMVGGWKGALLKPADRIFKKNGAGAVIPIYISGTKDKPQFGFDSEHMHSTRPERPDGQIN